MLTPQMDRKTSKYKEERAAEDAEISFWDVRPWGSLYPQPWGPLREAPLCSMEMLQSGQRGHSRSCSLLSAGCYHYYISAVLQDTLLHVGAGERWDTPQWNSGLAVPAEK